VARASLAQSSNTYFSDYRILCRVDLAALTCNAQTVNLPMGRRGQSQRPIQDDVWCSLGWWAKEARHLKTKQNGGKKQPKLVLRMPDLDQAKTAVISSLPSKESQRGYRHAIEEFITWYCSEPRLSFNKVVVTRYRIHLESRQLSSGTINGRLAAIRRLAYEAADSGLLSPELAAGIRRVKGAKKLGVRLGNWLTAEQAVSLWQAPNATTSHTAPAEW
jgi:hypothetical protein